MKRYGRLFIVVAIAGMFMLLPFGMDARAAVTYEQELPEDPAVKAAVTADGRTYESDNINDVWKRTSGKQNAVFKLYADWDIRDAIEIGGSYNKLTIDLNGHKLRRITNGRTRNGAVIRVNQRGELTIVDLPSSKGIGKGGVITGGNSSNSAGGIHIDGGKLTMNGGTIRGNQTSDDGGAICIEGGGTADLTGVYFDGNSADDSGGAIYYKKGSLTIRKSAFNKNKCGSYGGAVAVNTENAKLYNVLMENNKAGKDGGAIWVNADRTYLSGGTIKYNKADYGAGVYVDSAHDINIQGKLVIQDNKTTSNYKSNLCLQDGWFSGAKIYSGGLLHGSMVGISKTRSLSSKGYRAVVETTRYQERVYFSADRGKLEMREGKGEKVIYMATAFGELNMGPYIAMALAVITIVSVIVIRHRRKNEKTGESEGRRDRYDKE